MLDLRSLNWAIVAKGLNDMREAKPSQDATPGNVLVVSKT